ncbi:MAG: hypothetical protein ACRENA_06320 [Vulcanimicrobiaceae bacterium]
MTRLAALLLLPMLLAAAPTPPAQLHWIISQSGISRLGSVLAPNDLREFFDNPNTYVIVNTPKKGDPLPHAKHVAFYRDEMLMVRDLASGKLAKFDGVLYDDEAYNEPGNTTPEDQKENPLPYVRDAAKVLHAAGKQFLYTIGFAVGPKGQFWNATLPSVSPYPDVIDFQTQAAEGTPRFARQVEHLSRVYRANGGHLMLVGLAVAPKGRDKSAQDIRGAYDAALANRPPVDGFWLNIAVKSASCTGCAEGSDVRPGADFLRSIR